ncbi:hypothetical protein PAPHI01_1786 [Pancytospora philotis]|nr:hypothetical protein PAPHI01_1786 [Pancytospora philotis]
MPVCGALTTAAMNLADITLSDLQSFGTHDRHTLTGLERLALDGLFEHSWRLECSAIKQEEIDELRSTTDVNDKARYVILCVITNANSAGQLLRLLDRLGFCSHFLLRRLFQVSYVESLRTEVQTRFQEYFAGRVAHHEDHWVYIRQLLLETLDVALAMDIQTYDGLQGATNNSIDYAFIEVKKQQLGLCQSGYRNLWCLLKYWLEDPRRFAQRKLSARGLFKVLLKLNCFETCAMSRWKGCIVRQIIKNGTRGYISLLSVLDDPNIATQELRARITDCDFKDKSIAKLIWNYTHHTVSRNTHKRIREAIYSIHKMYFPAAKDFYEKPNRWNKNPRYFNKISPKWLREYFTELYRSREELKDLESTMKRYMHMLKIDVVAEVLRKNSEGDRAVIMGFMLDHLGCDARREYLVAINNKLSSKVRENILKSVYKCIRSYLLNK